MRCVGYRQLWEHLAGRCSLDEAVEKGVIATRQLAKRQWTWLRRRPFAQWMDPMLPDVAARVKFALTQRISNSGLSS
jgi:tRNA dimethylallyltransferase